jgi:glycerol-3-phosphate acyltransferase PlsY
MALDISKGAASVLAAQAGGAAAGAMAVAGTAAVVGHIYPVWLRFHGGKGVAVAAGVFAVLAPLATVASMAAFLLVVWTSRIISLGSIAATIALPSIAWVTGAPAAALAASVTCSALILFRHRANLRRIFLGTERRMGQRVA